MPKPEGVIIGFDFGTQRIGVAIGHTLTQAARPLTIVGHPPWDTITTLMQTWHPCALVVGYPLTSEGVAESIARKAEAFAKTLEGKFLCPVYLSDESFTTQLAKSQMGKTGAPVDAMAAAIILEGWLKSNSL